MAPRRGKLVVIDGSDGVGKATQTKLLVERLEREGEKVQTLDFPQYYDNFFGALIGECLAGAHGDFIALDPHIASVLYAADRFESKKKIEKWLQSGYTVILDRYVSANQMHQGGKIRSSRERKKFLTWLDTMEHEVFGLPRPDVILYLHLPLPLSLSLISKKDKSTKRAYLGNGKDAAEHNVAHLAQAQQSALKLIQAQNNWHKIQCSKKGKILSREAVHAEIYAYAKKLLGLY